MVHQCWQHSNGGGHLPSFCSILLSINSIF
nr:MAG TPA: hypothetical protein [Crassvirales sp.]